MPSPPSPDHSSPVPTPVVNRWLVEVGPLVAIMVLLWAKLVYFSALLPSEWWAPQETIRQWMRPAFYVVSAVQAHPEALGATLASLLVVFAVLPLLSRVRTPQVTADRARAEDAPAPVHMG